MVPYKAVDHVYEVESSHPVEEYCSEKVFVIVKADTIIEPYAVVVHSETTSIATTAVTSSYWFDYIAGFTHLCALDLSMISK